MINKLKQLLLALTLSGLGTVTPFAQSPPNVVLVYAGDLGYGDVS